jgi:Leucine-rich repeat (LRR) protein
VDNLRRCTKLKHLDLGFNHLRTVSYLSQVGDFRVQTSPYPCIAYI